MAGGSLVTILNAAATGDYAKVTATVVNEILTKPTLLIPPIAASAVSLGLNSARSVPLAIKESLSLRLPTSVDERSSYINKVRTIFLEKAKIDIDKIGASTLESNEKGKSARELGYTVAHIDEIIGEVKTAIEEIRRCEFIPERLEVLSKSVEATTSNGRAALVFITSVITKTLHLALVNTKKAAHQVEHIVTAVKHETHEHIKDA